MKIGSCIQEKSGYGSNTHAYRMCKHRLMIMDKWISIGLLLSSMIEKSGLRHLWNCSCARCSLELVFDSIGWMHFCAYEQYFFCSSELKFDAKRVDIVLDSTFLFHVYLNGVCSIMTRPKIRPPPPTCNSNVSKAGLRDVELSEFINHLKAKYLNFAVTGCRT